MKYTNKKTGAIAELVGENEKFKTVDLLKEDGTSTTISIATLKRWWKAIPEEEKTTKEASKYVEASQVITKELNKNNSKSLKQMVDEQAEKVDKPKLVQMPGTEDPDWGKKHFAPEKCAGDGTSLAQVGKEIASQAKDKAKKVSKSVKATKKKEAKASNSKNEVVKKSSTTNTSSKAKKSVKTANNDAKAASKEVSNIVAYLEKSVKRAKGEVILRPNDKRGRISYKLPGVKNVVIVTQPQKYSVLVQTKDKYISKKEAKKFRLLNTKFNCKCNLYELNDETKKFVDELINDILEKSKKEEK